MSTPALFLTLQLLDPVISTHHPQTSYLQLELTGGNPYPHPPRKFLLLIDTSNSMQGPKLGYAKQLAQTLPTCLTSTDLLSLVTFSHQGEMVLPTAQMTDIYLFPRIVENLAAGGSSALAHGLEIAYQEMRRRTDNTLNRILLISDGSINLPPETKSELLTLIRTHRSQGITLSTLIPVPSTGDWEFFSQMAKTGGGIGHSELNKSSMLAILDQELHSLTAQIAYAIQISFSLPIPPLNFAYFQKQERRIRLFPINLPAFATEGIHKIAEVYLSYWDPRFSNSVSMTFPVTVTARDSPNQCRSDQKVMAELLIAQTVTGYTQVLQLQSQGQLNAARELLLHQAAQLKVGIGAEGLPLEKVEALKQLKDLNLEIAQHLNDPNWQLYQERIIEAQLSFDH